LTQDNFNDKLSMALDKVSHKSAELDLGLIVGRAVFTDEKLYNAATVILPDGTTHTFNKNNLTAAEADYFTPGTEPLHLCISRIQIRSDHLPRSKLPRISTRNL